MHRVKTFRVAVFFVLPLFLIPQKADAGWDSLWNLFGTAPSPAAPQDTSEIEELRHFPTLVAELELLHANLVALHTLAKATGMQVTTGDMLWQDLLDKKVLRQFRARRALGVVVAGGTKAGKSSVFNHLAGREISAVSHVSGATKQAVLVVPKALYDLPLLQLLYPDMQLVENASPLAATEHTGTKQRLLVRAMDGIPDDTMYIDIPDVDSNETTNWEKAYAVTRSSDVVIAMITPEKHSDHAIIEFFRKVAADAGKPIVVVINKVHQSQIDEKQWVDWLNLFCKGTGIDPIAAYVVPFDMKASQAGKQNFFRIEGDLTTAKNGSINFNLARDPSVLREDIGALNVDSLKAQAQVGALVAALHGEVGGVNNGKGGILAYMEEIRRRSSVYRSTLQSYADTQANLAQNWPMPPVSVMNAAISEWWDDQHRYAMTKSAMQLVNYVSLAFLGKRNAQLVREKELEMYKGEQQRSIDTIIGQQFDALSPVIADSMTYLSGDAKSLTGALAQSRLLSAIKQAHTLEREPMKDFERVANVRLPIWQKEHPVTMSILQSADVVAHIVLAPVVTISGIVGGVVAPTYLGGALANNAVPSLGGAASGSFLSGKVNAAMDAVGSALGVNAIFSDFGTEYAALQVDWINNYLTTVYLAPMIAELDRGAAVDESAHFTDAETCAKRLDKWAQGFMKSGAGH
jgi:hypothetical protein